MTNLLNKKEKVQSKDEAKTEKNSKGRSPCGICPRAGVEGDQGAPPEGYLVEQPFKGWRRCLGQELTPSSTRKAGIFNAQESGVYLL